MALYSKRTSDAATVLHHAEFSVGHEPEVAVKVDAMYQIASVRAAVLTFQEKFPDIRLSLSTEALGAVIQPVLAGQDSFGMAGPFAEEINSLAF